MLDFDFVNQFAGLSPEEVLARVDRFDPAEHVHRGVCLLCGEGVLNSGEHLTGRREPCATLLAPGA